MARTPSPREIIPERKRSKPQPRGKPPTLGGLKDYGHRLAAGCGECQHTAKLDLDALIERFGRDLEAIALNGHLRCQRCGKLNGRIQVPTA